MITPKQSKFVNIPKSDLDSLEATIGSLQNEYVMVQLERSDLDRKKDQSKTCEEVPERFML